MIRALLLIFAPVPTWEHIAAAQRRWGAILLTYVSPLLLLNAVAEGYSLVQWGKPRGRIAQYATFSVSHAVLFEVFVTLLMLAVVVVMARLIKALGDTFHGRHTFRQTFTVAAYGMGPFFLIRLFDAIPSASPWLTWGIALFLSSATLYYGLPLVMRSDPPHAFGLYLMTILLLTIVTGLARFVTAWYLQGRLAKLEHVISNLSTQLPF
ncbi:MAG TPA: Yip1 family protein [Verrucomicrobiota bacterium]|nr:Yip1 family protein [Verrucomicrobiota bacterium]